MGAASVKEAADFFWRLAGRKEPFPRDLEEPASWGLPVAITKLPRLWGSDIKDYVSRTTNRTLALPDAIALKGFMLAAFGKGLLFIKGSDSTNEQRYSLAHEIAHFLLDYHLPRLRAIELFGPDICEVLDGYRPATVEERVHGILSHVAIGLYEYQIPQIDVKLGMIEGNVEDAADALAIELLAPAEVIGFRASKWRRATPKTLQSRLEKMLLKDFGLPAFAAAGIADKYTGVLAKPVHVKNWLGISE